MTSDSIVVPFCLPDTIIDPLAAVLRSGARRLLAQAIEAETDAFLAARKGVQLPDGGDRVVRQGLEPEQLVQTGIGPVEVRRVKLRDRPAPHSSRRATAGPTPASPSPRPLRALARGASGAPPGCRRAAVRATDTVARFGGDEFVVVLEDVNRPESLSDIVANLRQRLAQAIPIEGRQVTIESSIGVARFPADGSDAATLLSRADGRMYAQKRRGREPVEVWTEERPAARHRHLRRAGPILPGHPRGRKLWQRRMVSG